MVLPIPESTASPDSAHHAQERAPATQWLVLMAERELHGALMEQVPPVLGAFTQPSLVERAAVERAVRAICGEAHRLDLRAEELVIAIKKAWLLLGAVRTNQLAERDGDVLREIVSSSIELFFESRNGEGRRAPQ
jgi:hypothetical protein